ncbi:MAG: hypothetical protein E7Z89_08240 [Cyanobacteria bacterium SIG28]|nr:hypothetical protein [Cyanobacteria bacterium SIG28]
MITRLGQDSRNYNKTYSTLKNDDKKTQNPSFKSCAVFLPILQVIQECEKNPMINVAVIDLLSAILPRTFVESLTNWFAGFEAFRRESSGLIVNCLIPSFITLGIAKLINKTIMPKNTNMSGCWADSSLIQRASGIYEKTNSEDKIKESFKEIISNIEGVDGSKRNKFGNLLTSTEIEEYATRLKKLATEKTDKKEFNRVIKEITAEITGKTHIYENITLTGEGNAVKASTVKTLLEDSTKFFKEFNKVEGKVNMREFANKSKQLVKAKSILGMAVVLPLAASMQYINRYITEKISGVKGAPIYDDFAKNDGNKVDLSNAKEGLLQQKIISISSMIGVGLLSMMKMPSWNMFEFKGLFPTMDQARIISTTTFSSRMAVADDKNELAEATVRDIATFISLYFLGDYAAKATATAIEKKSGVRLLNDTKPIEKDANILKKFTHWMKDVNIKSSEEVVSKTAEELKAKNLRPTKEQAEKIAKELKHATYLRSACQVANLGVSLVLLGLIIPIWTRNSTKKKHAEALKQAQVISSSSIDKREKNDAVQNAAT